eukprot:scaffold1475_cov500-Pavlova_lutheri.AAC.1
MVWGSSNVKSAKRSTKGPEQRTISRPIVSDYLHGAVVPEDQVIQQSHSLLVGTPRAVNWYVDSEFCESVYHSKNCIVPPWGERQIFHHVQYNCMEWVRAFVAGKLGSAPQNAGYAPSFPASKSDEGLFDTYA